MRKIYVAGPMSGIEDLNFPAFHAEAARLRALGYEVVNPAELCPDKRMSWAECMVRDIEAMISCDRIALLPEWWGSRVATLEVKIARAMSKTIVMAADIKPGADYQDTVYAELEEAA